MLEWILRLHENVLAGAIGAAVGVLLGTRLASVGLRDYLLIFISAVLAGASVADLWMRGSSIALSAGLGLFIGILADDVVMNLNATLPDFIKDTVRDVLDWLREWLRRLLNGEK